MLNSEQQAVVDCDSKRILCLAGAGTGKSFSMLSRIFRLIKDGVSPNSILVLTFTNAAAFEMKERFKKHDLDEYPEFRTFHSFCYHLISTDNDILKYFGYSKIPNVADEIMLKRIKKEVEVITGIKPSKSSKTSMQSVHDASIFEAALNKLLKQKNLITFDSLCYDVCKLFSDDSILIQKYKEKYKYIFVDEFQDTDLKQYQFVKSFTDSNLFVVGDALQCQPAGTKVTMSNMSEKPIEDISPGDFVLTYNAKDGRYIKNLNKLSGNLNRYTKRVLAVSKHFAENVVRVSSANYSSCYTKDHITYARVHYPGNEDSYVTYLMSNKQGWWRVGSTKLFLDSQGSAFGPRLRLQSEHGDRIWILGVYKNVTDAWMNEQLVAYKFGIPQLTWEHNNVKFDLSDIELLYEQLGDMTAKATACLSAYGRDILYPIFTKGDLFNHFSKLHMFQIRVGNLIPGIFDLVYPQYITRGGYLDLHNEYEVIQSITDKPNQTVYGLEVEDYHNYVGDGILTHNCIYSFRNADSSIIKNLADDPEWVTFKLFRNYRSTKSICMYANKNSTYADDTYRVEIESDRLGGFIKSISSRGIHRDSITDKAVLELIESTSAFPGSTAILCRTNALANFVKSYLNVDDALEFSHTTKLNIVKSALDEEYGFNWVLSMLSSEQYSTHIKNKLVNKSYCLKDVNAAVSDTYIRSIINKIFKIRYIINSDESVGLKILDILAALDIVLSQSTKIDTIDEILMLEESENVNSSLHIGTIHSVKGLEYDNVIILGVNTESFRLTSEEENNLYYTAITRAKTNLYIVKGVKYGS